VARFAPSAPHAPSVDGPRAIDLDVDVDVDHPGSPMLRLLSFALLTLGQSPAPTPAPPTTTTTTSASPPPFTLRSPAFDDGAAIPARFTCEGDDVAPALVVQGVPARTTSLVLVVADPDAPYPKAPKTTWTHEIVFDLPPSTSTLTEARTPQSLPAGSRSGLNDWKQAGWRGPCPPIGRHRYVFTLLALDAALAPTLSTTAPSRTQVLDAVRGHVLATATLVGTYEKTTTTTKKKKQNSSTPKQ